MREVSPVERRRLSEVRLTRCAEVQVNRIGSSAGLDDLQVGSCLVLYERERPMEKGSDLRVAGPRRVAIAPVCSRGRVSIIRAARNLQISKGSVFGWRASR